MNDHQCCKVQEYCCEGLPSEIMCAYIVTLQREGAKGNGRAKPNLGALLGLEPVTCRGPLSINSRPSAGFVGEDILAEHVGGLDLSSSLLLWNSQFPNYNLVAYIYFDPVFLRKTAYA